MDADLDLLLTVVYCTVDDLLPAKPANARRRITDAEVITLCVAQAMLGCRSDAQFIAVAARRLRHLFPDLPDRSAFHKRRLRFARGCPGFYDDMLLVDSTPVECARSRETVKRGGQGSLTNPLSNAADYGYCASHSRFFWGFRLHALFALDGTPRALALTSPKVDEKEICLQMVARCERQGGRMLILIGDKNFRGKQFEADPRRPRRHHPPPPPQRREGSRTAPGADPPAHREHLLDRKRPPRPGAPPLPHPGQPPRTPRRQLRRPHRGHHAQPPTRPTQPLAGCYTA